MREIRLISVIGARPQFVKAAAICRAAGRFHYAEAAIVHRVIHTGQHYDSRMSQVFFRELDMPEPDYNLEAGSGSHAVQTALIMQRLEPVLERERPDWVFVYGDTNSTLAGGVTASKLGVPIAHIEAGLRSFDRSMPEEINRLVTDCLSDLLLCPTQAAYDNLVREGSCDRAVIVGDLMYDVALFSREIDARRMAIAERSHSFQNKEFALATVHRAGNTDDPSRLISIFGALDRIARERCPVIVPLHPRTGSRLRELGWTPKHMTFLEPAGYLDMARWESEAKFVLTDSGGVQKEAYFHRVPCITLRARTEWTETLKNGCNVLVDADEDRILAAVDKIGSAGPWTAAYGTGNSAEVILSEVVRRTPDFPEKDTHFGVHQASTGLN